MGCFRQSRAAQPGQCGVLRLHNAYPTSPIHTAFVRVYLRAQSGVAPDGQQFEILNAGADPEVQNRHKQIPADIVRMWR